MFCPSCGRQTPDNARFCTSCGAYLPAPAAAAPPPVLAGPVGMAPAPTTPSGQRYAGFWIRLLACIIDGIILQVACLILALPIILMFGLLATGGGRMAEDILGATISLFLFPLSAVLSWLYEATFTSSARQATPGKMALSLVVTDLSENRISFGRATGRHFGKYLSGFTLAIGYLIQPFTERRQALHDLLAGTLVLRR